jgi:cation/acetate symporter
MIPPSGDWGKTDFIRVQRGSYTQVFSLVRDTSDQIVLREAQTMTKTIDGKTLVNGLVKGEKAGEPQLHPVGHVAELPGGKDRTGSLGPIEWFRTLQKSKIVTWGEKLVVEEDGAKTKVFFPKLVRGAEVLRPGESPTFKGIRSEKLGDKMDFLSLMLALFCGTASLPHILIRYYTVKDESSARKSTIVGIGCIGLFYVLTLYMGLGAMTSGALDVSDNNMSAPLLARSINEWLFAAISAIAFTTVLGTVSGLILASSGAVTHDLVSVMRATPLNDADKVRVGKVAATVVGLLAMALGILFQEMNVNYLVGWAFSVAASANLPALVMLLFWKGTTKEGIVAGVLVGLTTSLAWILVSADTYTKVYGWKAEAALVPFSQPGIVTIPLGFAALVIVSWLTKRR